MSDRDAIGLRDTLGEKVESRLSTGLLDEDGEREELLDARDETVVLLVAEGHDDTSGLRVGVAECDGDPDTRGVRLIVNEMIDDADNRADLLSVPEGLLVRDDLTVKVVLDDFDIVAKAVVELVPRTLDAEEDPVGVFERDIEDEEEALEEKVAVSEEDLVAEAETGAAVTLGVTETDADREVETETVREAAGELDAVEL